MTDFVAGFLTGVLLLPIGLSLACVWYVIVTRGAR